MRTGRRSVYLVALAIVHALAPGLETAKV